MAVVDLGLKACAAYDRPDLGERLQKARARLSDPSVRVLVVGEFKQGKSSLVNALLDAPVCPVDDDIATSVPTAVGFAAEPQAMVFPETDGDEVGEPEPIPIDTLSEYVSEAGNPQNRRRIRMVEVGIPRSMLESGLVVVDTPGVGGLGSRHATLTMGALPAADAVILVSDASQEYTESELRFLARASELCPTVAAVLTKTDFYPEWRKVFELDRGHLAAAGYDIPLMPVSSSLRAEAIRRDDRSLNRESGFDTLVSYLRGDVVGEAAQLAARAAGAQVLYVASQLEQQFVSERDTLTDPEAAADLQRRLQDAEQRAERLKSEAARWHTTLNDGIADLNADVDHDFRGRTRRLLQEAETRIDEGDPADWWDEFEKWLGQAMADEIAENYRIVHQRTGELAETVAEHFSAAEADVSVEVEIETPLDKLAGIDAPTVELGRDAGLRNKAGKAAATGMTAIRGAYGGMFMFRTIGGMIGLAAMNPAILGLTALMGRKSIRDEKAKQLGQRRQQAKAAVRKYVDEVNFQIGKESRDTLRRVQRQLRDGFTTRAEEIQRSMAESLQRSQSAAAAAEQDRGQQLKNVEAELERITRLADRARTVMATEGSGA